MSALSQRKEFISQRLIDLHSNSKYTPEERIQRRLRFTRRLLWVQMGLYVILLGFILVLGVGSLFSDVLAERWEKAGLIAIFALTYTVHTFTSLMHRSSLEHLQKLPEELPEDKQEEAKTLNTEFRQLLFGRNAWVIAVMVILAITAVIHFLVESISWWQYLGPAYVIAVVGMSINRYHTWQKLQANIRQFEAL